MYVLVTEKGVYRGLNAAAVSKRSGLQVTPEEFQTCGRDRVAWLIDPQSVEIRAEIQDLERYTLGKLFRPDPMSLPNILQVAALVLLFILVVR